MSIVSSISHYTCSNFCDDSHKPREANHDLGRARLGFQLLSPQLNLLSQTLTRLIYIQSSVRVRNNASHLDRQAVWFAYGCHRSVGVMSVPVHYYIAITITIICVVWTNGGNALAVIKLLWLCWSNALSSVAKRCQLGTIRKDL